MARTLVMTIEVDEKRTDLTDPVKLMLEFMKVLDGREEVPGVFAGAPRWASFSITAGEIEGAILEIFDERVSMDVPRTVPEGSPAEPPPEFSLPPGPVFLKDLF